MKKKLAMLLSGLLLIGSLAACGGGTSSTTQQNAPDATDSTGSTGNTSTDLSAQEPYTVHIMMYGDADTAEADKVAAALSEITQAKFNTTIELTRVGFGSYVTQLNLALSSGEELDLFADFGVLQNAVSNGQVVALDDLLAEYGQDTLNGISDTDWAVGTIAGSKYMVPNNKDKAYQLCFVMRKDIVDALEIDVDSITDYDGIYEMLKLVKENYPEVYPVVPDFANTFSYFKVDPLSDYFGVILDPSADSTTVENFFTSDYYRELCEMMYSWSQEGLVMPDPASNSEAATSLIGSGKGFGYFAHAKPGYEGEQSRQAGVEMVSIRYEAPISTTMQYRGWCIAQNSEQPARAMQVLDLLYNDAEVANLVINGVEGVHWEYTDDTQAFIDYPAGVTSATVGYARTTWGWPNQQITSIWAGDDADLWDQYAQFNATAIQSPAKGFSFNNEPVLNQVTACTNVYEKYHRALTGGSLDPATNLQAFIDELEANGLNDIIEEKQAQLDAWLAAK